MNENIETFGKHGSEISRKEILPRLLTNFHYKIKCIFRTYFNLRQKHYATSNKSLRCRTSCKLNQGFVADQLNFTINQAYYRAAVASLKKTTYNCEVETNLHHETGNRNETRHFSVASKPAFDVVLGMIFIDVQMVARFLERRTVIGSDSNLIAILKQRSMPSNLSIYT